VVAAKRLVDGPRGRARAGASGVGRAGGGGGGGGGGGADDIPRCAELLFPADGFLGGGRGGRGRGQAGGRALVARLEGESEVGEREV